MIVGMAVSMQSGFKKGFYNYRKALDQQFNENVILTLKSYYQDFGTWDELYNNKRLWHDLINQSSAELLREGQFRNPPPRQKNRPPRNRNFEGTSNQRFRALQLPPISLFDANKDYIIGVRLRRGEEIRFDPIKVDNQVIGYLGLQNKVNIQIKQDKLFAENIKKMLISLGLIMIVLAVFISFPIAKYFTRLLNQITQATKKVAAGDYSTRINTTRKDELGELASHFNLLAQSLESSSESQKRIIADIAHELRTPISVILGEIEAIQDGIHKPDNNAINLLHSQILSLKNLVNDLHDLSESDLGALKYQMLQVNLSDLVEQSYKNHQLRFIQKNIALSLEASNNSCHILGDSNRLNQLLNNVLNNSRQYTDEGGQTLIKVSCEHDVIEISISDSSPSLKDDQMQKIFDRLYRADKSRNKHSGGSGLGLSICKEIVKAHNGTINASHSDLGGIEILIKLPKI